jgi:hypothetical protein
VVRHLGRTLKGAAVFEVRCHPSPETRVAAIGDDPCRARPVLQLAAARLRAHSTRDGFVIAKGLGFANQMLSRNSRILRIGHLRPAFRPVIHHAKHSAIVGRCLAALAPRNDVVGFHAAYFKMLFTDGAYALLVRVNFLLRLFIEHTQA